MNIKVIHTKTLRWIDVVNPGAEEMKWLRENFQFHPLHFGEIEHPQQHTHIDQGEGYDFIVLLFPVYRNDLQEILPGEVDLVIGDKFLITVHYQQINTLKTIFNQVHNAAEHRHAFMQQGPGHLLYKILESLFRRSYPILDHMNEDIEAMEKSIFHENNINVLSQIALTSRNIIEFRKMMKTHRYVLEKLLARKNSYLTFPQNRLYYKDLLEYSENIWDILEAFKETTETLGSTNQALATHRLNELSRVFIILSAIIIPATLIAFVFGIAVEGIPFKHNPQGFWIVVGLMALSSLIITLIFKKKRWL